MTNQASDRKPVCAVVGVGPGNGAALARRFHRDGYAVALLARREETTRALAAELPGSRAYSCDVADAGSVEAAFGRIAAELGDVDVVVYNAGTGVWGSVEKITPADFEAAWRVNTLGALLVSQRVIPAMKRKGKGSIVFIGATASKRGNVETAAFAPAKAAQRSLAESMARALGPAGVHVAIVIVDAVVDLPATRERMKDKPDAFFLKPDDLAETVAHVVAQRPSAWTFELDVRPAVERF